MMDKYYEANNCYYMSRKKRRRILKRIRSVCVTAMVISLFYAIGFLGAAENEHLTIARLAVYELTAMTVFLTSLVVCARTYD